MPKHFLHVMNPKAKAPAGDGDTKSWFQFYKWNVEGEVFFPLPMPGLDGVVPGDYLWFAEEGFGGPAKGFGWLVFGGVPLLRIEEENRVQELWYHGEDVLELEPKIMLGGPLVPKWIDAEVANEWLMKATRRTR